MSNEHPSSASITGLPALAFVAGLLMTGYGAFDVLESGAVLQASVWILGGLLLQAASGAYGHPEQHAGGLTNPFGVLEQGLREIRNRVRSWDARD